MTRATIESRPPDRSSPCSSRAPRSTTTPRPRLHAVLVARAADDDLLDVSYRTVDSPIGPLLLAATPAGPGARRVRAGGPRRGARAPRDRHQPADPACARPARRHRDAARRVLRRPTPRVRDPDRPAARARLPPRRSSSTSATSRTARPRATRPSPRPSGNPAAVRAAGSACAHNPIPLVVPCHRVVRSDGTLGGYRGGIEAKRALLAMEAACDDAGGRRGRRARLAGARRAS